MSDIYVITEVDYSNNTSDDGGACPRVRVISPSFFVQEDAEAHVSRLRRVAGSRVDYEITPVEIEAPPEAVDDPLTEFGVTKPTTVQEALATIDSLPDSIRAGILWDLDRGPDKPGSGRTGYIKPIVVAEALGLLRVKRFKNGWMRVTSLTRLGKAIPEARRGVTTDVG